MFFQKIPELSYKEVVTGLKKLGFQLEPKKSTGHEQWALGNKKVTVAKHSSPFDVFLVKLMAKQAGLDAKEFCRYCKDKDYP